MLEASLDYAAIIELDGPLRYLNPAARKLLSIDDDADLEGLRLADVVAFLDNDRPEFVEFARRAVRESGVHVAEGELLLADGERRRVSMVMLALTDGAGRHRATVCVARDGTDLHQAEQRVIERERWYRALVQHSADVVAVLDRDLSVRFASPTCRDVLGVDPESLAGHYRAELIHPEDLEHVVGALTAVRAGQRGRQRPLPVPSPGRHDPHGRVDAVEPARRPRHPGHRDEHPRRHRDGGGHAGARCE